MADNLLAKFSAAQGGNVYIEEHWSQDERDKVIEDIAKLGAHLRDISRWAKLHHGSGEIANVRGAIALSLVRLQEMLMPIYGADVLWPLAQATDAFGEAAKGKRHWLVTFSGDEPHIPQSAPYREARKALAAATLEYFSKFQADLEMNQSIIAKRIAEAMTAGGFKVRPAQMKQISARTVQDWRNLYASGKRPNRLKQSDFVIKVFGDYVKMIENGRGDKSVRVYLSEVLGNIKMHCQHHHEIFPSHSVSAARKT